VRSSTPGCKNQELREIDRLKNEFVAVLSHELRTPVTSINGYVELLLRGEPGPLTGTQERFVRIVRRNSARLLGLIEEMLLLAEAEAGQLSLTRESVDVRVIVAEAIESAKPRADAKKIELSEQTTSSQTQSSTRPRAAAS
jgi:signal transduction histidine kinase